MMFKGWFLCCGYENILYLFCICFVKKGWRCFVLFCVEGGYEYYFVNMIHMVVLVILILYFIQRLLIIFFVKRFYEIG